MHLGSTLTLACDMIKICPWVTSRMAFRAPSGCLQFLVRRRTFCQVSLLPKKLHPFFPHLWATLLNVWKLVFRALSGRLTFAALRHKLNKESLSFRQGIGGSVMIDKPSGLRVWIRFYEVHSSPVSAELVLIFFFITLKPGVE